MNVENLENIGYPIASINEDGSFEISKPENTGGLINRFTISEQILYELGNPEHYISPDICVDFTSFKLNEVSDDMVAVNGVKGYPATDTYKVSFSYFDVKISIGYSH